MYAIRSYYASPRGNRTATLVVVRPTLKHEGTGVHEESSTQVLGIGGAKGYDETLEGKALRAAVSQFIDNLIQRMEASYTFG